MHLETFNHDSKSSNPYIHQATSKIHEYINRYITNLINEVSLKTLLTFQEFMDTSSNLDEQTIETLILLAETHGSIRSDSTIQRLLNDKNARISVSELGSVLRAIHQRSVTLARSGQAASDNERLLIIMEQNVLNTAAATISAAVSARLQNSIDKLIQISSIKGR